MRSTIWLVFPPLALSLLMTACRTVQPLQRPVVSLFPTAYPASVLETCVPMELEAGEIRAILARVGWPNIGVGVYEAELISRGLNRRGYAELDARRADLAFRWLVFRIDGAAPADRKLILQASYPRRPPTTHTLGVDAGGRGGQTSADRDPYGYPVTITVWRNPAAPGLAVRRIVCPSDSELNRWEVIREVPLSPQSPDSAADPAAPAPTERPAP